MAAAEVGAQSSVFHVSVQPLLAELLWEFNKLFQREESELRPLQFSTIELFKQSRAQHE